MSKDAVGAIYTKMLDDDHYRNLVVEDPSVLDSWELSDEERAVLVEEATTEVSGFALGHSPAMRFIQHGPPMSPAIASSLGISLNRAAGLPTGSLQGRGFASEGCCPWGHPTIGDIGGMVE